MSLNIFVLCVQAKIDVRKHKISMDAVLCLIYIVHPSGSDIFDISSTEVKTWNVWAFKKTPTFIH